jgi:hypothetical protein
MIKLEPIKTPVQYFKHPSPMFELPCLDGQICNWIMCTGRFWCEFEEIFVQCTHTSTDTQEHDMCCDAWVRLGILTSGRWMAMQNHLYVYKIEIFIKKDLSV